MGTLHLGQCETANFRSDVGLDDLPQRLEHSRAAQAPATTGTAPTPFESVDDGGSILARIVRVDVAMHAGRDLLDATRSCICTM
ncbi:MAG: hypothetical protein OXI81_18710 [Paracoccaceae bacterium]|nr:hypothetical protein [Paracoccaceae bacterium]